MIKAIAIEGPLYAPTRHFTVEIICPDRVPHFFVCVDENRVFYSINELNLKLKWEEPTFLYEFLRKFGTESREQKIGELANYLNDSKHNLNIVASNINKQLDKDQKKPESDK